MLVNFATISTNTLRAPDTPRTAVLRIVLRQRQARVRHSLIAWAWMG